MNRKNSLLAVAVLAAAFFSTAFADSGMPCVVPGGTALLPKRNDTVYLDMSKAANGKNFAFLDDSKNLQKDGLLQFLPCGEPVDADSPELIEMTFEVPADGNYSFFARVMFDTKPVSHHDSLFFGIDDAPMIVGVLAHQYDKTIFDKTQWIQFFNSECPKRAQWPIFLKKGRHSIRISPREGINIGMIAVTTTPEFFRKSSFHGSRTSSTAATPAAGRR